MNIFEQSNAKLCYLGRNTINMLIHHKLAAQDSKRSHVGGSQVGDLEGSGIIEMLDEEISNFKSQRNRDPDEVDRFINDLIKAKLTSPRRGPVKPKTSI